MQTITKTQACNIITSNITTCYHGHEITPCLTALWLEDNLTAAAMDNMPRRAAVRKSYGVLFDGGSRLDLFGTRERVDCYALNVNGVDVVIVYGGYYCNAYAVHALTGINKAYYNEFSGVYND